jgi:precorrin-6B methylase 2
MQGSAVELKVYTNEMYVLYLVLLIILSFGFIALLFASFLTLLFIFPMAQGAVYVPSKPEAIAAMIKLGRVKKGKKVAELGCGDGRVVVALAQTGAEVHGYEINPLLVWRAKRAVARAGLQGKAFIHLQSYWDIDLGEYDVVTVYGITYIMKALEKKLKLDLKKGACVVSNYFTFPTWKKQETVAGVHLYLK